MALHFLVFVSILLSLLSLDNAETQLAKAKLAQGEAIRALESTRLGPMSGLFWWVGDYK